MRKIMYLLVFSLCISFVAMAKTQQGVTVENDTSIASLFVSLPAVACYAFLIGFVTGVVVSRALLSAKHSKHKKRSNGSRNGSSSQNQHNDTDWNMEPKYYDLEVEYGKMREANQKLLRQLAEAEQLSKAGNPSRATDLKSEPVKNGISENTSGVASSISVYFLQPTADGHFPAARKVDKASEALYELTYQSNNPSEASLKFIDLKDNTFLAVQNEPTWILVACERSNIPSGNTTSIRTDKPGKAVFINGEWEIIQKAKITYL